MGELGRVLSISQNEVERYLRGFGRRSLLLILVAGLGAGLLFPLVQERALRPDAGLYRVDTDPDSPLAAVVDSDERFANVGYEAAFLYGRADLLVVGLDVAYDPGRPHSVGAAQEFARAAERHFNRVLAGEADQAAAFPVLVNIVYEPRIVTAAGAAGETGPVPVPPDAGEPDVLLSQSNVQELQLAPYQIHPPYPGRALFLAFAYLIPLNFLNQFYAGSLLAERTRSRGTILLSAPLSGTQILLGKSLPYLTLTALIAVVVTIAIQSRLLGLLAILPALLFSMTTSGLFGLLARSYRELTFFIVTTNVLLSTFLFLPTIFIEVHPVSFLSPITVVASDIRHEPVMLIQFAYATTPLLLAALVCGALAFALYREEELFAPKTVLARLASAVRHLTPRARHLVPAAAFLVPFALGLEVFVLIFAVTLDLQAAVATFLLGAALVEEALKGLVAYAASARHRLPPLLAGPLIGLGFFLGEKLVLLFSLVGLDLLPNGPELLATYGIASGVLLVAAPLLLHAATATTLAYAARTSQRAFYLSLPLVVTTHALYNAAAVAALRGGLPLGP